QLPRMWKHLLTTSWTSHLAAIRSNASAMTKRLRRSSRRKVRHQIQRKAKHESLRLPAAVKRNQLQAGNRREEKSEPRRLPGRTTLLKVKAVRVRNYLSKTRTLASRADARAPSLPRAVVDAGVVVQANPNRRPPKPQALMEKTKRRKPPTRSMSRQQHQQRRRHNLSTPQLPQDGPAPASGE